MRNFSWVVPEQVAGLAFPLPSDAEFLVDLGVSALVSLTERAPDLPESFQIMRVPIPDLTSPSLPQLEQAVEFALGVVAGGGKVGVHCGAGIGRTGTVLAAYFVRRGMSAKDATARVRELRPGSIVSS